MGLRVGSTFTKTHELCFGQKQIDDCLGAGVKLVNGCWLNQQMSSTAGNLSFCVDCRQG